MIDWINQYVSQVKELIGGWQTNRKLTMVAKADHVELTSTHLVMGLNIGWRNRTSDPIPIKEIQVRMYLGKLNEEPLRLYPLERFARVLGQRALQKSPVRPFTLPPQEIYTENIRFISQEVLDIPSGGYFVDIQVTDTSDISYTSRTKIHLEGSIKYRRSEEWHEN